jgi:Ras-related protein Rab-2A
VEFGSKVLPVGSTLVKTMVWDTAGQESFKSIIRSYYKK